MRDGALNKIKPAYVKQDRANSVFKSGHSFCFRFYFGFKVEFLFYFQFCTVDFQEFIFMI